MSRWITVKRIACVCYLVLFTLSELYSAAAASLDRSSNFPSSDQALGRWLFVAPVLLLGGVLLLFFPQRKRTGFWMVLASLGFYAAFFIFEQVEYRGTASAPAVSWINAFWSALFLIAALAAMLLRDSEVQKAPF